MSEEPSRRDRWSRARPITTAVLLAVLGAYILGSVGLPLLLGAQAHAVLSAREDAPVPVGAVIGVVDRAAEDVRAGDIVTYRDDTSTPATATSTGRIVGVTASAHGHRFVVHGAHSEFVVPAERLGGVVVYVMPVLGFAAALVGDATAPGLLGVAGAALVLYGSIVLIVDVVRARGGRSRDVPIWDL